MAQIFHSIVHQCDTADEYVGCTFLAQTLKLYAPAKFSGCKFPNLRYVLFDLIHEGIHIPFDHDCEFGHALNFDFELPISCHLNKCTYRSIRVRDPEVNLQFSSDDSAMSIKNVEFIANKIDIIKYVRYGDDQDLALEDFKDRFSSDQIYFGETIATGDGFNREVILIYGDTRHKLGSVIFKITDHPFSEAILNAETQELEFDGIIPTNWWITANPELITKFSWIRTLKVKGISRRALIGMNVELRELHVSGEIGDEAFTNAVGYIEEGHIGKVNEGAFANSRLRLDALYLKELSPLAKLEAKYISIPDSKMASGILSVMTLHITDKVEEVLETDATKVCLPEGKGPITVKFPASQVTVIPNTQAIYDVSDLAVKVSPGKDYKKIIINELRKRYLDVRDKEPEILRGQDGWTSIHMDGQLMARVKLDYEKPNPDGNWVLLTLIVLGGIIIYYFEL